MSSAPKQHDDTEAEASADVEMAETVETVETGDAAETQETQAGDDDSAVVVVSDAAAVGAGVVGDEVQEEAAAAAAAAPVEAKRIGFASYLSSPVVTLRVGDGDESAVLTAHQALLVQSLYFARICDKFDDNNLDAVGCFLEFLYTGDYFPRKLAGHAHQLETDPSVPAVDETGVQLLKHARVYTLAGQLEMPQLQTLASSKIHCVNSTAKGEIEYARYVYAYTNAEDRVVRSPVAKFWATRSHTLRAEAEKEFQALCLEFPQFSYDVLKAQAGARRQASFGRRECTKEGAEQRPVEDEGGHRRTTRALYSYSIVLY